MNLDNAAAYQGRSGAALLNSEWGATNDPQVVERQTAEFDDHRMGDVFWDYRNLIPDLHAQPGAGNENAALLSALERPYPQVIAGTPSGWHWDPATDTFTLRYSTRRVGGRPGSGLDTRVYLPRVHYPAGYRVTVTGAAVARSGASGLVLRNGKGARAVSLTVTARAAG